MSSRQDFEGKVDVGDISRDDSVERMFEQALLQETSVVGVTF